MKRRQLLGVLGVGVLAKASDSQAAEATALAVRIVPTSYQEKIGPAIELRRPSEHFYVVVSNVSGKPIRLWKEWCSWGYFNLSFQLTDKAGRSVEVKKQNRDWTKNYPDVVILPPGGHHVREITFDPTTWENAPMTEAGKPRTLRLRAVYVIEADKDTKEHRIWTGRVSSPEESYELWRG